LSLSLTCLFLALSSALSLFFVESKKDGATILSACLRQGKSSFHIANYLLNYTARYNQPPQMLPGNGGQEFSLCNVPNANHKLPLMWLIAAHNECHPHHKSSKNSKNKNTSNMKKNSNHTNNQKKKTQIVEGISFLIAAGATLTTMILYSLDATLFGSHRSTTIHNSNNHSNNNNHNNHNNNNTAYNGIVADDYTRWWGSSHLPDVVLTSYEAISGVNRETPLHLYFSQDEEGDKEEEEGKPVFFVCHQCVRVGGGGDSCRWWWWEWVVN